MLIFRMGQWPCGLLYCQEKLPLCWLWIAPTMSPCNYPTYKTKNYWHSIDTHFQDGAGSMMLLSLAWKAANTSFMNGCTHLPLRLPKMHSPKSLMRIFRMGQWPYGSLFCQEGLPICWLWIALTTSPFNYLTYNTQNPWRSIDAHFNVVSSQDLLPLIIAFMNIWT